jgi:hypothetical protein
MIRERAGQPAIEPDGLRPQVNGTLDGRMCWRALYLGSLIVKANEVSDGKQTQESTEHVDLLAS